MAIIQCHECKKNISDTAEICPSCGSKTIFSTENEQSRKSKKSMILIVIGLVIAIFIGRAIYIEKQNQEFIDSGAAAASEEALRSINESNERMRRAQKQ